MTEPTTATGGGLLLATLTAAFGPLLGEWTLIFVGGFVGSFLAVTALETVTIKGAAVVLFRGLGMSVLFTSVAVTLAAPYIGSSADLLLLPIAGVIGWQQDKLLSVVQRWLPSKKEAP